jgi:hypothetical protein
MDLNNLLRGAANQSVEGTLKPRKKAKAVLQVWNKGIAKAIRTSKASHWDWKQQGRPNKASNHYLNARKESKAKQELCHQIRKR